MVHAFIDDPGGGGGGGGVNEWVIKIILKGNLLTKDKPRTGREKGRESETGREWGVPTSTARKNSHV